MIALCLVGCAPELISDVQRVQETRILGVRSIPAEARPRDAVRWEALVASPEGTQEIVPSWAWCVVPRRVEERTAVSASCASGEGLVATSVETTLPAEACSLFGPTPLPADEGEQDRRPTDPDPSGGYYQPVQAGIDSGDAPAVRSFGRARVRCDLAGATRVIFDAFEDRYVDNAHPEIQGVESLEADPSSGRIPIVLSVSEASAEPYVVYRAEESALFDQVETLTATWYTTSGQLSASRTPVVDGQARVELSPEGEAIVWTVVRDDRGGMDWIEVEVRP